MTDPRIAVLAQAVAYDGHFKIIRYRLRHRLFAGGMSPELVREVFERGHAVAVLPFDPESDKVVLVEQFRLGAVGVIDDPWLIEPVAGIIEPGEGAPEVARREAAEEAGLELLDLVPACTYFASPGGSTETCQIFIGRVVAAGAGGIFGRTDEGEDIRVHVVRSELRSNGCATAAPMRSRPSWPCNGWPCIGPGWNSAGAVAQPDERRLPGTPASGLTYRSVNARTSRDGAGLTGLLPMPSTASRASMDALQHAPELGKLQPGMPG